MYRNCPSAHPIRRPLEPQTVHLSFGQRVRRVRLVRSARVHVVGNRAANATIGAEPRVNGQYTALLHGGAAVHGRPVGAGVLGARRRRRERVRPDGEGGSAERCAHGGVAIGAMSGQLCCRRPSPIFFGGLWGLGEMVVGWCSLSDFFIKINRSLEQENRNRSSGGYDANQSSFPLPSGR